MLAIPQTKFNPSVKEINIDPDVLADWIEASLLFDENEISKSDIVDVLIEEQICRDESQDLAHAIADRGWTEIKTRQKWGGISEELHVRGSRITDIDEWSREPIRAFFLLLSIQKHYPKWAKRHRDYVTQGELFERIVESIGPALLPGWKILRTGWSPDNTVTIKAIVGELCEQLNTLGHGNLDEWVDDEKDGGLDIVCFREFPDRRETMPTIFIQCASGANWRDKIHTPNAEEWQKWLDSAVQPSTGIAAPFVICTKELRKKGLSGQVVMFDRIRLLHAAQAYDISLGDDLREEVVNWINERVEDIPTL